MPTTSHTLTSMTDLPPTVDIPTAGIILGIGRTTAYALAARDEFPVQVLRIGSKLRVPTARLLELLEGASRDATVRPSTQGT
jgi:predicted DNA-binding transcriptional regulator AlpA